MQIDPRFQVLGLGALGGLAAYLGAMNKQKAKFELRWALVGMILGMGLIGGIFWYVGAFKMNG